MFNLGNISPKVKTQKMIFSQRIKVFFYLLILVCSLSRCSGFSRSQGWRSLGALQSPQTSSESTVPSNPLCMGAEATATSAYSETSDSLQLLQGQVSVEGTSRPQLSKQPSRGRIVAGRFEIKEATRKDLESVAQLCIDVFFPPSTGNNNPVKQFQKRQLMEEQLRDLSSRCRKFDKNAMFKAIDMETGKIVGFVEVTLLPGYKYGMGEGMTTNDYRPVLSNLAVDSSCRRKGVGQALEDACCKAVRSWGYSEIVLQVEELNSSARKFYKTLGYNELFVDRAARRYDTSGFFLRNVRTSKICMQKYVNQTEDRIQKEKKNSFSWGGLFKMLGA